MCCCRFFRLKVENRVRSMKVRRGDHVERRLRSVGKLQEAEVWERLLEAEVQVGLLEAEVREGLRARRSSNLHLDNGDRAETSLNDLTRHFQVPSSKNMDPNNPNPTFFLYIPMFNDNKGLF